METLKKFTSMDGLFYDYANFVIRTFSKFGGEENESEYLFGCETLDDYSDSYAEALEFFEEMVKSKASLYCLMSSDFEVRVEMLEICEGRTVVLKKMKMTN